MTDIFAALDTVIREIGQKRRLQFPLFPPVPPALADTGISKHLETKGFPAPPVLPVENHVNLAQTERIAANKSGDTNDHNEKAPEEYSFKITGITGITGSPQGICGSEGSRGVPVGGKNGETTAALATAATVEQAGIARLSEHALFIGIKIRSALDLEKVGTSVCLEHWSTEVWVACYAIGGGPMRVWRPGSPVPEDLAAHVRAGKPLLASEAAFERAVWSRIMAPRHGWPEPRFEQWHCVAALSAAMALPRTSETAAKVLGLCFEQGSLDNRLTRQLGTPREIREIPCALCGAGVGQQLEPSHCRCNKDPRCRMELVWLGDPAIIARGIDHCIHTLETARRLLARLQPLPSFERQIWHLDQRINERGVSVDLDLARMAHRIVEDRLKELNAQLSDITGGAVRSATQIVKLLSWLRSNGVTLPGGAESNKLVQRFRISAAMDHAVVSI